MSPTELIERVLDGEDPADVILLETHSPEKCMNCDKPPTHEAIWADGRGRAWFCDAHWKMWATKTKDIVKQRKVTNGKVGKKYGVEEMVEALSRDELKDLASDFVGAYKRGEISSVGLSGSLRSFWERRTKTKAVGKFYRRWLDEIKKQKPGLAELNPRVFEHISGGDPQPKPPALKQRFKEVGLAKDKKGYFVYTHRARSPSYPSPEKIPLDKIKFIASTG